MMKRQPTSHHQSVSNQDANEKPQQDYELLALALRSLTYPFYVIDASDYSIILDNSQPGLKPSEPGIKCYSILHGGSRPCHEDGVLCPMELIKDTKKPTVVEHVHRDKDGKDRVIAVHGYPVFDKYGNVASIIEYSLDITDRRAAMERHQFALRVMGLLNQSTAETDTIRAILYLIKDFTGLEAIGIRLREGDDFPYYETSGFPTAFVEKERSVCARDADGNVIIDKDGWPELECMCGNVIRGRTDPSQPFFTVGGSFWTNSTTDLLASTTEKDRQGKTRNICNATGFESVALVPLRSGDETIGLLQLNDRRKNTLTLDMITFFEGLGASVGIALARNRAEEALQQAHDELEQRVEERTAALKKTTRALQVLSECNQSLVHAKGESDLLENVCKIIVGLGRYRLVWVGYAEDDEAKTVRPVSQAGFEEGYLERLNITWDDVPRGRGPTGTAIRTGQPSISKDILTDPKFEPWQEEASRRGYASSIALPLRSAGRILGALNIYAAESDAFDDDEVGLLTELAEDLAFGIVSIRTEKERQRADQALRYRLEFEELIAYLSTSFINLKAEEIDSGIGRALKEIGEFTEVDRSYIFLYSNDGKTMSNTHEWCQTGIMPQIHALQNLSTMEFPWSMTRLRRFETVHVPKVSDLPMEAAAEKKTFTEQRIKSLVLVPMVYHGMLLGFVGLDSVKSERIWDDDTMALLRIVAEMFVSAIVRSGTEKELLAVNEQLLSDRKSLEAKNIAMREILSSFEDEKQVTRGQITTNVEESLLPLLNRIKERSSGSQLNLVELLEKYLKDITSPFIDSLKRDYSKLTPRELEICSMIKAGRPSKEIALTLNVSLLTVHKHREQIRKKLGLKNSNINLNTFLQAIEAADSKKSR